MGVDTDKVSEALDWAMRQEAQNTRSIVVVYDGKIIGERYAPGWTKDTPQISWSEGKSITSALVGVLVEQGELDIDDFAPIKEWRTEGDPRGEIRIRDLLRMSSGLDFTNLGVNGPLISDNQNSRPTTIKIPVASTKCYRAKWLILQDAWMVTDQQVRQTDEADTKGSDTGPCSVESGNG